MGKRYRKWQEGHDDRLEERYDRLPGPLRRMAGLYPSQQRQPQRETGRRQRLNTPEAQTPQGPPPGWYQDPDDHGMQRWWDGTTWTEHRQP